MSEHHIIDDSIEVERYEFFADPSWTDRLDGEVTS